MIANINIWGSKLICTPTNNGASLLPKGAASVTIFRVQTRTYFLVCTNEVAGASFAWIFMLIVTGIFDFINVH